MINRTIAIGLVLASLALAGLGSAAHGQVARYQPRTSTVSPYLNLGRFNSGGLPNYYALVRPQIQQRQFNAQAEGLARAQQAEINRMEYQLQRGQQPAGMTGTGSWFMTPGTQSSYLDTSRFYPDPRAR